MSHRILVPALLALALLVVAAPAPAQEADSAVKAEQPADAEKKKKIKRHPDRISLEELNEMGSGNALEAVRRLRSGWLRSRGVATGTGGDPIVVYMDGVRVGGLEALEEIRVNTVEEIRRLKGTDANIRYGRGHDSGAIVVKSRS